MSQKFIKQQRDKLIGEQGNTCRLCLKEPIHNPVLDHDHKTGHIRAVLCNGCNRSEGKIQQALTRYGSHLTEIEKIFLLANLRDYQRQDYSNNPIHPKHKCELTKQIQAKQKALKTAKLDTTKLRLKLQIKELKQQRKQQRGY